MYESTLELITLVSSNSHLVFCFCNVIIGILFVTSSISNPPPTYQQKIEGVRMAPDVSGNDYKDEEETSSIKIEASSSPKKECISDAVEVPIFHEELIIEDGDNKNDEEQGDDDELRIRAEEFIAKVNRAWKAEKYGTFSPQVHREHLHGHLSRSRIIVV
ncbi:hypothetical protein ACHQM5_001142 [Ranunculus cassubicifolius]